MLLWTRAIWNLIFLSIIFCHLALREHFFDKQNAAAYVIYRSACLFIDKWYYYGYTSNMKTAISIPDKIYKKVEQTARKMGISRSKFFSIAAQEFIHHYSEEDVTNRLNEIYPEDQVGLDKVIEEIQARSMHEEEW